MESRAIEEIMRNLASARDELRHRQAQFDEAEQSLRQANLQGASLVTNAKAEAQNLQKPWQDLVAHNAQLLQTTEGRIANLEEMLFIAMQIIQDRIEKD